MQTVTNIPQDYVLTRYFAKYYSLYSVKSLPTAVACNSRLRSVLNIVNRKAGVPLLQGASDSFVLPVPKPAVKGRIFVAFSSGKDCLATAIRAAQDGFAPTLVYVSGVNKSLPSEKRHAENIARASGFPFREIKLNIQGNKEWNEHPMKNLLILSLLIDEGLKEGVHRFGFGNCFDDDSAHCSIDYDLSDSFDLLRRYIFFVRQFVPDLSLYCPMCNTLQSFYTIQAYDRRLIPLLSTCITPDFRRPMIRKANIAKYGADVMPADGCGGCYKCADEYLYRLKFGFVRNSPAYVQKCMSAKAQFDIKYKEKDFKPAADRRFNRWGGRDTAEVQVLVDRVGYYIGTLEYDKKTCKWYTRDHFGSHHYPTREAAEAVCERFKQLYRI